MIHDTAICKFFFENALATRSADNINNLCVRYTRVCVACLGCLFVFDIAYASGEQFLAPQIQHVTCLVGIVRITATLLLLQQPFLCVWRLISKLCV